MLKHFAKWFDRLMVHTQTPGANPQPAAFVEPLESRRLMAVLLTAPLARIDIIEGAADDCAAVVINTQGTVNQADDVVNVHETTGGVTRLFSFPRLQVSRILFFGGGGNDCFYNSTTSLVSDAYGGPGDDRLNGGGRTDRLYGGGGNDLLIGYGGDDWLFGEGGVDSLSGSTGNDNLDGGYDGEIDQLTGGAGTDTFITHIRRALNGPQQPEAEQIMDFNDNEGDRGVFVLH